MLASVRLLNNFLHPCTAGPFPLYSPESDLSIFVQAILRVIEELKNTPADKVRLTPPGEAVMTDLYSLSGS